MVDPTPGQTPPSLKVAAGLSDTNEYAAVWTGQSNSRPWGYPEDGFRFAQELRLEDTGEDIVDIVIPDVADRSVGMIEELAIGSTLSINKYSTSTQLRLGTPTVPLAGYADVIWSGTTRIRVKWLSLPKQDTSAVTFDIPNDEVDWADHGLTAGLSVEFSGGTPPPEITLGVVYYVVNPTKDSFQVAATSGGSFIALSGSPSGVSAFAGGEASAGYMVRENGKFASYEQVRVCTPYVPLKDIEPPPQGMSPAIWIPPRHAPYPAADGALNDVADGRRLTLPAPWTLPAAVTSFSDLAVFLPITRREGITGYGISEIADSTFPGIGTPQGHPIKSITGQVFDLFQELPLGADLTRGYLIVDWEDAGASKRSWARIASNTTVPLTTNTFTTDATSWLGDGKPATPVTLSVTVTNGTDRIGWAAHGFAEGTRVFFDATTAPGGVTLGRVYVVRNPDTNTFQISESMGHSIIDITTDGADVVGYEAWSYTAWVPHWKDNPFAWLPGPEFAYPNEDQQPRGGFVHNRPRGQLIYVHQNNVSVGGGTAYEPFDGVSDARFGAMLPFGWRVGSSIGKRINFVCLGVNSVPLSPGAIPNYFAHLGEVGWYSMEQYGIGLALEDSTSQLSHRIKRLIEFIAPNAMTAEGNTKSLRYLSMCHVQGETDSLVDAGREIYVATITDYKRWLRDLITAGGWNPYANGAEIPFAQPLLTRDPWETTGAGTSFQAFGTDANGEVNDAMRNAHTSEEFSEYTLTEDIPKLRYDNGTIDQAHFSGEGMAVQGARLAAVILDLIEYALAHSSTALGTTTNPRLLRIANQALLYLGESSYQITTLTESTAHARLVSTMMPEAILQLLSMRQWSWTLRQEPATQVANDNPQWLYAYVVPGRAVSPIRIYPATQDDEDSLSAIQTGATSVLAPITLEERGATSTPEPFEIGRRASGHRILYTNVPEIEGDVSALQVADGELHPERLARRPTLLYVDKVVDPDRFSPSFATALSWLLASMLAPAMIKGKEGDAVAVRALQRCAGFIRSEAVHETVTQQKTIEHIPNFIAKR